MDDRYTRIDELIRLHHDAFLAAVWHNLLVEAARHERAVDRLLARRYRMQQAAAVETTA